MKKTMQKNNYVTVGQLKQELADVPDDALVLVYREMAGVGQFYENAVTILVNDSVKPQEVWFE